MSFNDSIDKMCKTSIPEKPTEKIFEIREFLNIEKGLENGSHESKKEEYFNMLWSISITKDDDGRVFVALQCTKPTGLPKLKHYITYSIRISNYGTTLNREYSNGVFAGPEDGMRFAMTDMKVAMKNKKKHIEKKRKMNRIYTNPDKLSHTIVIRVKILKTELVDNQNLKTLEPIVVNDDMVLKIQNSKIRVNSEKLSERCHWFSYLADPIDSDKTRLKKLQLETSVDPWDFEKFLQILDRKLKINDYNLEGVLLLGAMFGEETIVRKCKKFLIRKSTKSLEKKLQLALQYGWMEYRNLCILKIDTFDGFYKGIPSYLQSLNWSSLMEDLENMWVGFMRREKERDDAARKEFAEEWESRG